MLNKEEIEKLREILLVGTGVVYEGTLDEMRFDSETYDNSIKMLNESWRYRSTRIEVILKNTAYYIQHIAIDKIILIKQDAVYKKRGNGYFVDKEDCIDVFEEDVIKEIVKKMFDRNSYKKVKRIVENDKIRLEKE